MQLKYLPVLLVLAISSIHTIKCSSILSGIKFRIESSIKSEPQLEWIAYGSTIAKASTLEEADTLYVTPRFDASVTPKAVHDQHYNTALLCLHSATAKSCIRATHDKDLLPIVKVKVSEQLQGDYDVYYLLFTPGGGKSAASEPILWALGSMSFQSGKAETPTETLDKVGPNAWRDSTFKMPVITPTDPPKHVPGISVFTPFFVVLFLAPWLLLVPMWHKLGANAQGMKSSLKIFVQSILFFGSLVLLLCVLLLNWLYLDIFSTIRAVVPLSVAVVAFGAVHLRSVALERLSA